MYTRSPNKCLQMIYESIAIRLTSIHIIIPLSVNFFTSKFSEFLHIKFFLMEASMKYEPTKADVEMLMST